MFSKGSFSRVVKSRDCMVKSLGHWRTRISLHKNLWTLPKRQILDPSRLKDFADEKFEFDENGRFFSKRVENTVGKEEIARNEQFLFFPQCFQRTFTADT